MEDARIVTEGLGKSYGPVTALADVSLSVGPGRILAVLGHNGAGKTTLVDILSTRSTADTGRARTPRRNDRRGYDVVVEATSRASGLRHAVRALAPGGVCTAVGYYLATGTRVPLMRMYATDATLRLGVSHTRAILPDLLDFLRHNDFPAERVTTHTAAWDEAPDAYTAKTTKLVLRRDPLTPDAEEP